MFALSTIQFIFIHPWFLSYISKAKRQFQLWWVIHRMIQYLALCVYQYQMTNNWPRHTIIHTQILLQPLRHEWRIFGSGKHWLAPVICWSCCQSSQLSIFVFLIHICVVLMAIIFLPIKASGVYPSQASIETYNRCLFYTKCTHKYI